MLNKLRDEIHQNAINHGWWEEERTFGDIIALCHSELSEALEEYRENKPLIWCADYVGEVNCIACFKQFGKCRYKPEGIAIELADCIIRILDYCGHKGIDIENAIWIKHEYNKTRPYRHGGKII
jgi:NTP pyrophosphatase (non-canonical NTP hydrolase)